MYKRQEYNKEDENWPIPQMLIHTVVENIYKHAVSVDNLITILVQVNKTEYKLSLIHILETRSYQRLRL